MANKPNIRFKGFTDDWEQRKLSEIATMHARIGWQNLRTSEFLDKGDYMLITGTDFDDGRINYSTCHYVEKERYDQDTHIQIHNGNILITKDGTLGKVAYVQELDMPATLNAGVFNVEIKNENHVDGKFLFQYLKAPFLMEYVGKKATGGTIKHLNQNILVNFPIVLPKKAEQDKIGRCFENIDHLITLHQRKCDETKKLKKFMLQKMFPKNGEKNPEIRFAGFTDDWEQRKLSEGVSDIGDGLHGTPIYSEDGKIYFINGNNLVDGKIVFSTDTKKVDSDQQSISDKSLDYTTILMSINGTIGNLAYYFGEKLMLGKSVAYIKVSKFDKRFVYSYLQTPSVQRYFKDSLTGTTIKNLGLKAIREMEILVPLDINVQKKVGNYFSTLDHLITLHQRKCDNLKLVKKFMLQNMFPQKG